MYSFDDGGGRSLTLRPRARRRSAAPTSSTACTSCRRRSSSTTSSFFRAERPQAGRYRQFWQVGAEALGSDDPALDAELIVLLAKLLARSACARACACASRASAAPRPRAEYREELRLPARARGPSSRRGARADRAQPTARVRLRDPGTRAVMASAPRLLDRSPPRTPSTSPRCEALLDAPASPTRSTDARPRPRLLHAHRVRVHQRRARRPVGRRRRRALRRPVELLGGPPTPGIGWAAGDRADPARVRRAPAPHRRPISYIAHGSRTRAPTPSSSRSTRARPACAQLELAGRSLKGQLKHADRLGARYVAIVLEPDSARCARWTGEQPSAAWRA
jgi:histidyl-tRNA synthetase